MPLLSTSPAKCLLAIVFASSLWAGREFPAKPGEIVIPTELIVKLRPQANIAAVLAASAPTALAEFHAISNIHRLTVPAASAAALSALLAANPDVDYVEPNRIRHASVNPPNDNFFSQQWALSTIQALQAWTLLPNQYFSAGNGNTGRIKVAILDTGADCTHPDFKNGGASTDTAQGGQFNFALSQAPVATTIASPACPWLDDHGHGTHTAGTIAASTQNAAGVSSLGYSLQLIVFKILDHTGSGSDVTISDAIKAAADDGASVISLSLGGGGYSQTLQNAVNYAWQRNALVVAAAGNNNSSSIFYPADANYAVGVGATDSNDLIASFSNFGLGVDLVAPGVGILSTYPTYYSSGYASLDGTSMATPHVAALAGLIASSTANVPAASIALRLQQSADSTIAGGDWDQHLGFGRINAWRALSGTFRSASLGGIVGQVVDSNSLPLGAQIAVGGKIYNSDPSNGLYRFSSLAPGSYSVVCTSTGFTSRTLTATVVAGGDTTLTIPMGTTPGWFTGVVSRAGTPTGGVVVQALSGALISGTAVSAPNGSYTLYVPAGTYTVRASDISNASTSVASQSVTAGGLTVVNLNLTKFGSVSGTVKDASLNPVQYAQVAVTIGGLSFGAVADATGAYSTIGIPAGVYTVTASAPGYQNVSASGVAVVNGAATPVNLQFGGSISFTPIRVNAGASAPYTDTLGQIWAADNGFPAGCGGLNQYPNAPIGGVTTAPGVYRSFHNGDCTFTTAVPNGNYTVNLMFAEVALNGPGRSFNVFLNGQPALQNFDVYQAAGGANLPVVKPFPVTVTNGQITVQLAIVNYGAIISGIEILASSGGPVAVAVSPHGPVQLGASGTQPFTATVTGTSTTTVTWGYSPQVGTLVVNGNTATYTAPSPISIAQNVTVTATSTVDGTKSASGIVSLTPTVGVSVSPQGPVPLGALGTQTFTATVTGTGTTTVTWGYSPQVGTLVVNGNTATYTAPNSISITQNVTVTATSTVDGTKSSSGTVSLTPGGGGFTPIRVDAGSTTPYTDTLGQVWAADSGFNAGCGGVNAYPNAPIGGVTTAPGVYRSFHYGDCTFTAAVPNGNYTVNLMFAEVALNGPGRIFNVYLNGQSALQNFDVYQTAGGANLPVVKSFPVAVASGQITVQLSIVNYGAFISGIEILGSSGGPVAVAVSPQGPVPLGASGTQPFTATVTGTGTTSVTWGYSPQVGTLVVNGNTATYTAPNPITLTQNVTVTATSTVDGTKSASGTVSLTPAVVVSVSPQGPVPLGASGTQPFTATVSGTGTTTVTWGYSPQLGTLVVNGNTATYTAPSSIGIAQNVIVTATSTVDVTKSASGTVSLTPSGGGFTPIRVDAGSTTSYTDTLGQVWAADSGFNSGCGGVNAYPNAPIGGVTTAPGVYRSFHYGDCTFTAAVPNGNYTVNLMFAEVALNGPGRTFNVFLNGQLALSNFDVFQTAGGANLPVVKSFPITVANGQVTVQLSIVNYGAIISGIEILSASGGPVAVAVSPQGPVQLSASGTQPFTATVTGTGTTTVTWGYSPQLGTLVVNGNTATYTAPNSITIAQNVTVTATSTVDGTKSASGVVSLTPPSGSFTPIRMDAGSTTPYTDTLGQVWAADSGFNPGCGGVNAYPNAPIGGITTAPGVYRSFHYGDCTFTAAVPNGNYTVNLMFAEVALNGPGRTFNVFLDGQLVLSNFDVYQTAGGANLPVVRSFPITVANGQITVQLSIVNYGAIISGIEIVSR